MFYGRHVIINRSQQNQACVLDTDCKIVHSSLYDRGWAAEQAQRCYIVLPSTACGKCTFTQQNQKEVAGMLLLNCFVLVFFKLFYRLKKRDRNRLWIKICFEIIFQFDKSKVFQSTLKILYHNTRFHPIQPALTWASKISITHLVLYEIQN